MIGLPDRVVRADREFWLSFDLTREGVVFAFG
jgi:hypothetical protein